jgi:hypothetical protein
MDRHLLAFIARRFPAAWDVIPRGPLLVGFERHIADRVALNPQPIPPGDAVGLNPQPLPPREIGARVAAELLQLTWIADRLGQQVSPISDWEDDPCPTWPKGPKLPPHIGPTPPEPGPDWLRDYHLGLASTLATAEGRIGESSLVTDALERSVEALTKGLG